MLFFSNFYHIVTICTISFFYVIRCENVIECYKKIDKIYF